MTDSGGILRHDPRLEPPNWPRLTISVDATTGTVALAGSSTAVSGATLDDTRLQAIDVATDYAARIGRPLYADARDSEGSWSLLVYANGRVEDLESSHRLRRFARVLLTLLIVAGVLSAAWVGILVS